MNALRDWTRGWKGKRFGVQVGVAPILWSPRRLESAYLEMGGAKEHRMPPRGGRNALIAGLAYRVI